MFLIKKVDMQVSKVEFSLMDRIRATWHSLFDYAYTLCMRFFLLSPVHPATLCPFLPCISSSLVCTDWIRCRNATGILIRTYLHGDNEASSSDLSFHWLPPSLPPHVFMLLSYDLNAKSIGVLFEKWTIDPVLNDNSVSTVECTGMGPGLHICSGGPAGSQCPHIINSSSHSPLVCSGVLSDQACCDPLHLSPSIEMKNDLAKRAVLHAPGWTPPCSSTELVLLWGESSSYLLDY